MSWVFFLLHWLETYQQTLNVWLASFLTWQPWHIVIHWRMRGMWHLIFIKKTKKMHIHSIQISTYIFNNYTFSHCLAINVIAPCIHLALPVAFAWFVSHTMPTQPVETSLDGENYGWKKKKARSTTSGIWSLSGPCCPPNIFPMWFLHVDAWCVAAISTSLWENT